MIEVGCLWDLHRRMRTVLVGCRMLIAVDGSRDLMKVDAGYQTVSGCEHHEMDVVVAAGMGVLAHHMRTVVAHFEADIVALGCESLSSLVRSRILGAMDLTWWSAVRTRGIVATRTLLRRWALLRITTVIAILGLALATILGL